MATSVTTSTPPKLLYGNNLKSSALIGKPETQAGIVSVSRELTTARESLEAVQREDEEQTSSTSNQSRRDTLSSFENADRSLLQKGVLLSDSTNPLCLISRPHGSTLSNVDTHTLVQLQNGTTDPSNNPISLQNRKPTDPASLIRYATVREGPGSPDSGYGNTPDGVIKASLISPSSRSRSSSTETTTTSSDDSNSTRRTLASSGIPSSLWSGHESTLELLAEGGDEEEDSVDAKESSNSDEGGDTFPSVVPSEPDTSIVGPLPVFNPQHERDHRSDGSLSSVPYFNPDDNTLVQVAKRKGISRSSSMEDEFKSNMIPVNNELPPVNSQTRRISKTDYRRRRSTGRKRGYSFVKGKPCWSSSSPL